MRGTQFGNGMLGSSRVNPTEIKSKSEEERIKFVYDNLIGKIKSECKEYDLDITARYKLVKMVMDNTTNEVREYADKIKRDLNIINSISDDIDVEDSDVGKPPLNYKNDSTPIETLMEVFEGTEVPKLITKGSKIFKFYKNIISASIKGFDSYTVNFYEEDYKRIVSEMCKKFKQSVRYDEEVHIVTSDFEFLGSAVGSSKTIQFHLTIFETDNTKIYLPNTSETNNVSEENKLDIYNLMRALNGTKLDMQLKKGIRLIRFKDGVLSVSRDGIQFKSLEFNDNLIHTIRAMLGQLFNCQPDEKGNQLIRKPDFIFDGRDLYDGDKKEFELKLYPTKNVEEYFKAMNTVEFEVTEFEKKTSLRNLLLNSDLSTHINEGIKVFIFQGNDLVAMPSEKRLDLKFEVEDAEVLVDSIGKIFGHMNLSSKKYVHLKSNIFELVVSEGPDEYLTFKLDLRKFPGLPVKEVE